MRIAIAGATGRMGRALVEAVLAAGATDPVLLLEGLDAFALAHEDEAEEMLLPLLDPNRFKLVLGLLLVVCCSAMIATASLPAIRRGGRTGPAANRIVRSWWECRSRGPRAGRR